MQRVKLQVVQKAKSTLYTGLERCARSEALVASVGLFRLRRGKRLDSRLVNYHADLDTIALDIDIMESRVL